MKQHTKLLAATLLLVTAVVMVIATSYAWMTISNNPVLQGIQVTVAGGGTVLVAPDITVQQDGKEYHYPGEFAESLNFSGYEQYDYLGELGGLIPVSTSDGQTWYIPAYYSADDPEVLSGEAYVGELRPTTEFIQDDTLTYANLTAKDLEEDQQGSYVYLDFWVVAPVDGYTLRVSTSSESAGSYVIDLLDPEKTEDGSFALTGSNQQTAACMRLGFLVNQDTVMDDSMVLYTKSEGYNSSYSRLQGIYAEAGCSALYSPLTRFTIYEPNGDLHPAEVDGVEDGQYALTQPLGEGGIAASVSDRLTVQLKNSWAMAGEEPLIAQIFKSSVMGRDLSGASAESLKQEFYTKTLSYQYYAYITKGNFIASTAALYAAAEDDGIADEMDISALNQAGATDDVYLTELTGGVPQRIRLFVWLEGQDVDCINAASTGSFAISVELSGSNAS